MEVVTAKSSWPTKRLADTVADEIAFDLINQGMAEGLIQKRLKKLPRKWAD